MAERTKYDPGIFCWVDLVAHDLDAAEGFYSELLGWTAVRQDTHGGPPYTIWQLNGKHVAGAGQMSEEMKAGGVPPMWNSYISVEDADAVCAKATELGGNLAMPVMDVMDAGRMAFLQDPTGGTFAVWQPKQHIGAQHVNDPGCFCWNELITKDKPAAEKFYGDLFGWTFENDAENTQDYDMIRQGEALNGGMMTMPAEMQGIPSHWVVYFSVADIQASVSKLESLGGQVIMPPFPISVGQIAVVADPQGAVFDLIQMSVPPDA